MNIAIITVITELLKETVGLIRDWRDPDKRKQLIELTRNKNNEKAINIAEEIFLIVDELITTDSKDKAIDLIKKYHKKKKEFNKYD